jgi:hypothetical protein
MDDDAQLPHRDDIRGASDDVFRQPLCDDMDDRYVRLPALVPQRFRMRKQQLWLILILLNTSFLIVLNYCFLLVRCSIDHYKLVVHFIIMMIVVMMVIVMVHPVSSMFPVFNRAT